jgi:HEAT repeat protein
MKLNRRKAATLLVGVFMIAAAFLGWRLFNPPEPVYQGKPLSDWVRQFSTNFAVGIVSTSSAQEAEQALRQIGPEALPYLLRQMRVSDSALKKRLRATVLGKWHDRLGLRDRSADIRRLGAHGIHALGTNAAPAAQALIEIATRHPDEDARYLAVFGLRKLAPVGEPVFPFLVQCLTNSEPAIRDEAALALGGIRDRPEIVVSHLIQYLQFAKTSPSTYECSDTVWLLSCFGTNAKAATPILLELLHHSSIDVRSQVPNSFPLINAEAAAKAEVKGSGYPFMRH